VDGCPILPVEIDVSQDTTDTIDYVVTLTNAAYRTRTRIVEGPLITPANDASSATTSVATSMLPRRRNRQLLSTAHYHSIDNDAGQLRDSREQIT
jgi:hypothetical protein